MSKKLTQKEINRLQELYNEVKSISKVHKITGVNPRTIAKYVVQVKQIGRLNLICNNCGECFSRIKSVAERSKSGNHYCSVKCSTTNATRIRSTKSTIYRGECEICLEPKLITQSKVCSIECHKKRLFNKGMDRFLSGECISPVTIKKYLIHLNGHKCTKCGLPPLWCGEELVLQVDHIDGDSDNNLPKNLRLLCPNCHTQTPTYGTKGGINKETTRNKYLRKYKE